MTNPDQLAAIAPPPLSEIWAPETLVLLERRLWVEVLRQQRLLGRGPYIDPNAEIAYLTASSHVDLDSIRERERTTRHDVKARIEEFNALAGYQLIHLGLTSADVVEYCYSLRLRQSLVWLIENGPDAAKSLAVPSSSIPFRGLKGAVGTQQDLVDLYGKDGARLIDRRVAQTFGVQNLLNAVGQVNIRSLDLQVVSALGAAVSLHAGVAGPSMYRHLLAGFITMCAGYSGDTWNEGDVASSAVRRVALPGAVYAAAVCLGL